MSRVLLAIDLQVGIIHHDHAAWLVDRIAEQAYEGHYAEVVATHFVNLPDSPFRERLHWTRLGEGDPLGDVHPTIATIADHVMTQTGYGVSAETIDLLRAYEQIDICGLETDQSIAATTFQLWDAGLNPAVLANMCVTSAGTQAHHSALDQLRRAIGPSHVLHPDDGKDFAG